MVSTVTVFRRDGSAALDCTTEFSADYYGFGVRLGVYLSWLSSYFANTLLPGELSGSQDTNSIFLLGMIISLLQGITSGNLFQIDGLIVLHLCSGFLFSCLSIWGYRTLHYQKEEGGKGITHFGGVGTHIRLALIMLICVVGGWFWLEGTDDGLKTAEHVDCQVVTTWFFAKFPIDGGIHIWYATMSIGCAIYYGLMCVTASVTLLFKVFTSGMTNWSQRLNFQTGFTPTELNFVYTVMRVFNLFWIIFCILMVEMTISQNNMLQVLAQEHYEISAPAQLLPLLIGSLGFVRTLWLIGKEHGRAVLAILRREETEATTAMDRIGLALVLTVRKLVSPGSVKNPELEKVPSLNRVQSGMHNKFIEHPRWQRYLLAYLPWLSAFYHWRDSRRTVLPVNSRNSEIPSLLNEKDTVRSSVTSEV